MTRRPSSFHVLRWLLAMMLSLLWTTIGSTAALAERIDFGQSGIAANSGPVVYRQLSAADRIALDAGQPLMPKGTGGTILDHIRSQPTGHISVSETAAGTARFNGGNGLVEINVNAATAGGARFVPHADVLQGVGARPNQIRNVLEAQEALFEGPIPAGAVRLIK